MGFGFDEEPRRRVLVPSQVLFDIDRTCRLLLTTRGSGYESLIV